MIAGHGVNTLAPPHSFSEVVSRQDVAAQKADRRSVSQTGTDESDSRIVVGARRINPAMIIRCTCRDEWCWLVDAGMCLPVLAWVP